MNTLSNASPGPRARGAAPLARVIERRYGGRDLPLALVLPDGGRVALSEAPEVDVIARSPVRYFRLCSERATIEWDATGTKQVRIFRAGGEWAGPRGRWS